MLFQIYGDTAITQLLGWVLVFAALVLLNELARRTKAGGIGIFVGVTALLTVYFIVVHAVPSLRENNWTVNYMDGWFHYFKLYAAVIGCIGFMMIKYEWGLGKKAWFKPFPWLIVAANIMIAVVSDMESAIKGYMAVKELTGTGTFSGGWWVSNEGVFLYGGWWNIANALAGVINIFCMTSWWKVYSSKDKNHSDMVWPDMTAWFIVAYDIWNFQYTYANLPTHSWYCGVALLLAPTFANAFWNKGGWIQNRANTLAIWCMFAQVVPMFQLCKTFSVVPSLYAGAGAQGISALDLYDKAIALYNSNASASAVADSISGMGITANPTAQGVVSLLALVANVICIMAIIKRSKKLGINPYKQDVWVGTKDYEEAMERAEVK